MGSNSEIDGAVNSADLRKPKKTKQQAAFKMTVLGLAAESHALNSLIRIGGVMRNLGCD